MKKYILIFVPVLILTLLLSGCAELLGEEEAERPQRLDSSKWPTLVPTEVAPTSTPFPKSAFSATATPVAADSANTEASNDSTSSDGGTTGVTLDFSHNPLELAAQINELTGFTPTGAAMVTGDGASLQSGPEAGADSLATLSSGDMAALLGKSKDEAWIYVVTDSLAQGWLAVAEVRLIGTLAKAPVLSAEQVTFASETGSPDETNTAQVTLASASNSGDVSDILSNAPGNIFSELPPAGTGIVKDAGVSLRNGPSTGYGSQGAIEQGEVAGVMGTDSTGDWYYIATLEPRLGWIPVDNMHILGELEDLRVLPPDPVAALLQQRTGSSSGTAASNQAAQVITAQDLEPMATASVSNVLLNLRQRPGPGYALLDSLAEGDQVNILALNRDKEWALLETESGQLGWGSMDYLTLDGSVAEAPQLLTLEPAADHPADQVAPMTKSSGVVLATNNQNTNSAATGAIPASTEEAVASNTLAPITTGQVTEKVDMRQGPATSYPESHTLYSDTPVTVRGRNEAHDWVLVEASEIRTGWLPVNILTLAGSVAEASVVQSGWVRSNEIEVNSGPGIFYDTIGTLGINSLVSILGLSEGRNWLLIQTMDGYQGWTPLRFVKISGTVDDIPLVEAPPLAQETASEQAINAPSGPPSGQLVLQTASGDDIMLINADGTGLRSLTKGIDPVLSPDGSQVAFTRWQGDAGTLWVINSDGTGERVILNETRKAKGPDWSPDSSQIVLNFQHGGRLEDQEQCQIYTGSFPAIPRNTINAGVRVDGRRVDFCWTVPPDEQWSLRVVNVADGAYKDIYGGIYAFRPAWDPGQTWRIVSDSGNGLLAIDVNRDDFRQPLTTVRGDGSPVLSPDGRFIVVTTDVQGGYDIFRMNADGSGRVRLTETPLWVPLQPDGEGQQWRNVAPVWSPDGSRIAFLTNRTDRWEIWLMNADGSNPQPMFSEEINTQLNITYNFVDERVLSWR